MMNVTTTTIRVAPYVRVSSLKQVDNYSVSAQLAEIEKYCKVNDYEMLPPYIDNGISGAEMKNRPGLQQMLKDLKDNKLDKIVVWKLTRLGRSMKDILQIIEECEKNNTSFYSVSEHLGIDTDMNKLMLNIMGSLGEYERTILRDNIRIGASNKASEGKSVGGQTPYGYDRIDGHLIVNQHESRVVKDIYQMYSQGMSFTAIANVLNDRHEVTKLGKPHSKDSVSYILENQVYLGLVVYNQYVDWKKKGRKGYNKEPIVTEGEHEAIISKKIWDKVQTQLKARKSRKRGNNKTDNLLTGLLKCKKCHANYVISNTINTLQDGSKRHFRYYICRTRKQKSDNCKNAPNIRADYIENYVFQNIKNLIRKPDLINNIVEAVNHKRTPDAAKIKHEIANKQFQIEDLRSRYDNLIKVIESDGSITESIKPTLLNYSQQINELETSIKRLESDKIKEHPRIDADTVMDIFDILFKNLKSANKSSLKAIYHLVIEHIYVKADKNNKKRFYITFKFNQEIVDTLLNNINPDEQLIDCSSSFLSEIPFETFFLELSI
ncbi:recombinase family protein [Staphylococcus durrellii]|uniref:recombinase family protein n=1 Tax=Staphylococcus durrellii TaxID=2781773 RepID=UPI00189F59A1|nr:recombinase family protein [Staphylococcus durrellii]MBF7018012.1 recombinase family protein [Staphylococcus durrellii]